MRKMEQYKMLNVTSRGIIDSTDKHVLITPNKYISSFFVDEDCCKLVSQSQNTMLDVLDNFITFNEDRSTDLIIKFDFSRPRSDKEAQYYLKVLQQGFYYATKVGVNESGKPVYKYTEYKRFLRSVSSKRAGGALFCPTEMVMPLRNLLGLGKLNDPSVADIKLVPSKEEAMLSLALTTGNPISLDKDLNIRVVPDIQREIVVKTKGLVMLPEEQRMTAKEISVLESEDEKFLAELGVKYTKTKINKYTKKAPKPSDNPNNIVDNFTFEVQEGERTQEIELIDGESICSMEFMNYIHEQLHVRDSVYSNAVQFRMPLMKGMMFAYDINGYCDEFGINTLVDIYGEEFNPRDCDIIAAESVFKGKNLFKNIHEYMECLNREYTLNGVTSKQFPHKEYFRACLVSKKHDNKSKFAYQFFQSLLDADPNFVCELAKPLTTDIKEGVLQSVEKAKTFLGSYGVEVEQDTLRSKAQQLLEVYPQMYRSAFVRKKVLGVVDKTIKDLPLGKVPVAGGYNFIAGDLSLLLCATPELVKNHGNKIDHRKKGYKKISMVVSQEEKIGLLNVGENFNNASKTSIGVFRSPQIHPYESLLCDVTNENELANKYFGHLKGVLIFNSYEALAIALAGADYDGDKTFVTNDTIITQYMKRNNPVIISPLEGYSPANAKKTIAEIETLKCFSEMDEKTLDNQTGLLTNMATFYVNEYYHYKNLTKICLEFLEHEGSINHSTNAAEGISAFNKLQRFFKFKIEGGSDDTTKANIVKNCFNKYRKLVDYRLTVLRVCQASEIDFPKHGVRFPIPVDVQTSSCLDWKDHRIGKNINPKKISNIFTFDTPLQRMRDNASTFHKDINENSTYKCVDCSMELINRAYVDKFSEYMELVEKVSSVYKQYADRKKEIYEFALSVREYNRIEYKAECGELLTEEEERFYTEHEPCSESEIGLKYSELYSEFEIICSKLHDDRKLLASACSYVVYKKGVSDNSEFPFVCAFDGVLMNLSDYSEVSTSIIRVEELDKYGSLYNFNVGGSFEFKDGIGVHSGVDVILENSEIPNGIFDVFSVNGKHYMKISVRHNKEYVDNIIQTSILNGARYTDDNKIMFSAPTNTSFMYNFTITGLGYNGYKELYDTVYKTFLDKHNCLSANKEFKKEICNKYKGDLNSANLEITRKLAEELMHTQICSLREVILTAEGNKQLGLEMNGKILGVINAKDLLIEINGKLFDMSSLVNKTIKVTDVTKVNKMSLSINCSVNTTKEISLTEDYKYCHFNSWYWNTEIKRFIDLGLDFDRNKVLINKSNINVPGKPVMILPLNKNGVEYKSYVFNDENNDLYTVCYTNEGQKVSISKIAQGTILRYADYRLSSIKLSATRNRLENEVQKIKDSHLDIRVNLNKVRAKRSKREYIKNLRLKKLNNSRKRFQKLENSFK